MFDRFIRDELYHAKREYGVPIVICHRASDEVDVESGERIQSSLVRIVVNRAAMLPSILRRESFFTGRQNRQQHLSGGGSVDVSTTEFIVDRADVDSLPELTASDWIEVDSKRYQIHSVEDLHGCGWLIVARHLSGQGSDPLHENAANALTPGVIANDN